MTSQLGNPYVLPCMLIYLDGFKQFIGQMLMKMDCKEIIIHLNITSIDTCC